MYWSVEEIVKRLQRRTQRQRKLWTEGRFHQAARNRLMRGKVWSQQTYAASSREPVRYKTRLIATKGRLAYRHGARVRFRFQVCCAGVYCLFAVHVQLTLKPRSPWILTPSCDLTLSPGVSVTVSARDNLAL